MYPENCGKHALKQGSRSLFHAISGSLLAGTLMLSGCDDVELVCTDLAQWAQDCGVSSELAEEVEDCTRHGEKRGMECLDKWLGYLDCAREQGCPKAYTCEPPYEESVCK